MRNIVFHPSADRELVEAVDYYDAQEMGLGLEYLAEVENSVLFLAQYPEAGFLVEDRIRKMPLPRFPYYLLYRILPNNDLRILAVAHHRRKPGYGLDRN